MGPATTLALTKPSTKKRNSAPNLALPVLEVSTWKDTQVDRQRAPQRDSMIALARVPDLKHSSSATSLSSSKVQRIQNTSAINLTSNNANHVFRRASIHHAPDRKQGDSPAPWIPDPNSTFCSSCNNAFTVLRRRVCFSILFSSIDRKVLIHFICSTIVEIVGKYFVMAVLPTRLAYKAIRDLYVYAKLVSELFLLPKEGNNCRLSWSM